MADTLELEIATPEREIARAQVSEVEIPGKSGYLGVLPGHAPLLGLLGFGTLTFVEGGKKRYIAIHAGFLEIMDDHVRVLANAAEPAAEIDVQRAQAALKRAQEQGDETNLDPAAALEAALRAQARLATAEKS